MRIVIIVLSLLSLIIMLVSGSECSNNVTLMSESLSSDDSIKVLSRRKRFLIFPDGSSVQLVFCTQNHGYIQIGDIIWFGNTAALAWELPTDPKFFYFLKDHKDVYNAQRRTDTKNIYYLNEDGKVIAKVPYKRKPLINPAFAKRSIDETNLKDKENTKPIAIKQMHEITKKKNILNDLEKSSIEFHRNGRKGLYAKLEKFLEALGWGGRDCVLRFLCETGNKNSTEQGSFLEEIVRATFTLPGGREFTNDQLKPYDIAHGTMADCREMYSDCVDVKGSLYAKEWLMIFNGIAGINELRYGFSANRNCAIRPQGVYGSIITTVHSISMYCKFL